MRLPNKYVALDIETSGSEGDQADIIQIGAVILNEDLSIGREFMTYIKPTSEYREPKAMEVNGISEETLASAPTPDEALSAFEEWAKHHMSQRPQIAAWGIYFDLAFMKAYYKRIGRKWPFAHKGLCLKAAAIWEASQQGIKAAGGLGSFCEELGLTFTGTAHDGLDDIKMSVTVLQNLNSKR